MTEGARNVGSDSEKLLPCPFCGGPAIEFSHQDSQSGDCRTVFGVNCENEDCPVEPETHRFGPWGYRREDDLPSDEEARRLAIQQWNTRPTMPSQVEGCECGGDMTKICGSRWCLATPPAPSEGERVANELMSFVDGDHLRGCEGRNYSCSCGYDETKDKLATKAATLLRTAVPGVSEEELARIIQGAAYDKKTGKVNAWLLAEQIASHLRKSCGQ